jgi:hypothetical protein
MKLLQSNAMILFLSTLLYLSPSIEAGVHDESSFFLRHRDVASHALDVSRTDTTNYEIDESSSRELMSQLELNWRISRPKFNFSGLEFYLNYTVSNSIEDTFIEYKVFDGLKCSKGGGIDITNNDQYLLSNLTPDLKPVGDGSSTRDMLLSLVVDADTIKKTPLFEDFGTYAHVDFCVRFSVYRQNIEGVQVEINFKETPIRLEIDLVADVNAIQSGLTDAELLTELAQQDSAVEAFLCDSGGNVVENEQSSQGTTLQICVRPTEETTQQGASIRQIESFYFEKVNATHYAIQEHETSELTVLNCPIGSSKCSFEALLPASFFNDAGGIVHGEGTALLQFGSGETRRVQVKTPAARRRDSETDFPEDEPQTAPNRFGFDIMVLPVGYRLDDSSSSRIGSAPTSVCVWAIAALQTFVFFVALL